tara:strand:+ start:4725 stop:6434 length:1710 start_codon:yes stop_codon:yes gene_type:complete
MNLVLFTGGSGNANLIRYLKTLSFVNLSLLINGYDDGLSTGTIRSANYGMLGPSDYRKNFTYILDDYSESNQRVKQIFDYRISTEESKQILQSKASFINRIINSQVLDERSRRFISKYLWMGLNNLLEHTEDLNLLNDFSVGNIIIGGLYEETGDFNSALYELTDFFDLNARLINVSVDDDSKLVAFDSHSDFMSNEVNIVNYEGTSPLKDFFLLPLDIISELDHQKNYSIDEIRKMAVIPNISESAKNAIENADLILFGSGTLFSSLLPSYRICKTVLSQSNAKKVLIVNNDFDSDIRNISLNQYINLNLKELESEHYHYFDRIIVDKRSVITNSSTDENYPNVVETGVMDQDRKHNGYYLWKNIIRSLDRHDGICLIKIIFPDSVENNVIETYRHEIDDFNKKTYSEIRFEIDGEKTNIKSNYFLILDTSGKINLHDIVTWIKITRSFNFSAIFGYRFFSRRQLLLSFKKKLVESKVTYLFSLMVANVVSLIYAIRFFKFKADPLSGIYLIRSDYDFKYTGVPEFLKFINKNQIEILSLPITYRTFKNVDYLKKTKTLLRNIVKLFI